MLAWMLLTCTVTPVTPATGVSSVKPARSLSVVLGTCMGKLLGPDSGVSAYGTRSDARQHGVSTPATQLES